MKANLMFQNKDFTLNQSSKIWNAATLQQDLELSTLCNAMAKGNDLIFKVSLNALLSGINNDIETINYRQEVLNDSISNSKVIRELFSIATEAIESKKNHWFFLSSSPSSVLYSSMATLKALLTYLKKIKAVADEHSEKFVSRGFTAFFSMIKEELTTEYLIQLHNHLLQLDFNNGTLFSANLGSGNKGCNYVIRKSLVKRKSWIKSLISKRDPVYTFSIHPRDEAGARALRDLRDEGINQVANTLAQSMDHILNFFELLRIELAFYVGCINLQEKLVQLDEPISFPIPTEFENLKHSFSDLYDICLTLTLNNPVIGNELISEKKRLFIITGANKGGKSTFLRSIGISQLMMQAGMFVPATYFTANVYSTIYTHYKREEDNSMQSGKFDEELSRMNEIINHLKSNNTLFLFNESFAATNEREGSEVAYQIVTALREWGAKIFFVTHLYEFARNIYDMQLPDAYFLRAERLENGNRTFKLIEGLPLQTSFGKDIYNRIFTDKYNEST